MNQSEKSVSEAKGQNVMEDQMQKYIDEAEQQLLHLWHLPYVKQRIPSDSARTHFEVKYLERAELCQQLIITKPESYQTRFDEFLPLQGQGHAE